MDKALITTWLADFATRVNEGASLLTELDRQIGDADHGSNLDRGLQAAIRLDAADFDDAAALTKKAGMTLVSTVGGASGPLYGTLLLKVAAVLPEGPLDAPGWAGIVEAALQGVQSRGKALEGDKTMVDALAPAARTARECAERGETLARALHLTAISAAEGRDATIPLVARKGRASYLGERSRGHQDPGATSTAMLFDAAARTLA